MTNPRVETQAEPAGGDSWAPRLTFTPEAGRWRGFVNHGRAPTDAARFREQLGLPAGPVVMSGHQAEIWHAGILTKALALDEIAKRAGATSAWVLVDQDSNEPGIIRYPAQGRGKHELSAATWRISATSADTVDVPIAGRPAFTEAELAPKWPEPAATGPVACGLAAIRDALLDATDAESLATQMMRATKTLLRGLAGPGSWVRATSLAGTDLFASMIERMKSDPARCIALYNAAAKRHAGAGMAALAEGRGELPLWRLRAGMARGRMMASGLDGAPMRELAPRALLMTGLLRYAGCDLFVHGLGGGVYDVITEEWLGEWLGWTLAPAVVATGTLLAKLADQPPPSPEEVARARWSLHHARHTPGTLGDSWSQRRKEELVEEIRGARGRGEDPSMTFRSLQELLGRVRLEHATEIAELSKRVKALGERSSQAKVALDRTWAFPLHEPEALASLSRAVRAAFEGA